MLGALHEHDVRLLIASVSHSFLQGLPCFRSGAAPSVGGDLAGCGDRIDSQEVGKAARLEAAAEARERAEGATGRDDCSAELRQRVDHLECQPRPPFLGPLVAFGSPGDRDARVGRYACNQDAARLPGHPRFVVLHEPDLRVDLPSAFRDEVAERALQRGLRRRPPHLLSRTLGELFRPGRGRKRDIAPAHRPCVAYAAVGPGVSQARSEADAGDDYDDRRGRPEVRVDEDTGRQPGDRDAERDRERKLDGQRIGIDEVDQRHARNDTEEDDHDRRLDVDRNLCGDEDAGEYGAACCQAAP